MDAVQVRSIRKFLGLSQEAFGAAVGVKGRAVSKWETGRARVPYHTAARILKTFRIDPASLLIDQIPTETHVRVIRGIRRISDDDAALVGYVVSCQIFQIVCEPPAKTRR